jgi:hypothetical protein
MNLVIGPFLVPAPMRCAFDCREVTPLEIQLECANHLQAIKIPLFRYRPSFAPDRFRAEDVVFAATELPFKLECSELQIVKAADQTFLPVGALLEALYARWQVQRSIFAILTELASNIPLEAAISRCPADAQWHLVAPAEEHGFRVRHIIQDRDRIYVEIGWRPPTSAYVFHTCVRQFRCLAGGDIRAVRWAPSGLGGISLLLERELKHLVPDGLDILVRHLAQKGPEKFSPAPLAANQITVKHNLDEQNVPSGYQGPL